ncbi:hypothetical protein C7T94_14150 [Pedobacter yulinensis]|uniref:Uncharacterized protein n=1 Tax=Pedobacter yulinensis TaxID=2126353 RepID=A0A2T3HMS4_9SPHI|nr:hypothetical protein C7T94_14150 [Pedobacter yulinensis]
MVRPDGQILFAKETYLRVCTAKPAGGMDRYGEVLAFFGQSVKFYPGCVRLKLQLLAGCNISHFQLDVALFNAPLIVPVAGPANEL